MGSAGADRTRSVRHEASVLRNVRSVGEESGVSRVRHGHAEGRERDDHMSDRSHINQQDYITAGIRQEAAVEELHRARRLNRPSALYKPELFQDGNAWCALYGRDIAVGVTGWGDSPEKAMEAFDVAWTENAKAFEPKGATR